MAASWLGACACGTYVRDAPELDVYISAHVLLIINVNSWELLRPTRDLAIVAFYRQPLRPQLWNCLKRLGWHIW